MLHRIGSAALALVLGFITGTIMTFGHQANVVLGGVALPWGLIIACLGVTAALVAARLLTTARSFTLWLAIGIIGTVAVLAQPGPSGTVLIPNGLVGIIWVFAPTAIAVFVVLWPTRPAGRLESVERTLS